MSQSILYRWFGVGGVPRRDRAALEAEGIVFSEVGIWSSITFQNYSSPHLWATWKKIGFLGSLILTRKRFVVYREFGIPTRTLVEIPADAMTTKTFRVTAEGNRVCVLFDVEDLLPKHHGKVTLKFRTTHSAQLTGTVRPA